MDRPTKVDFRPKLWAKTAAPVQAALRRLANTLLAKHLPGELATAIRQRIATLSSKP